MSKPRTLELIVADHDGRRRIYRGRDAWALRELIQAGDKGCTPICTPGPRWSGYIHNLRRDGLDILTIRESHNGPFPGHHARYILRTHLTIVDCEAA